MLNASLKGVGGDEMVIQASKKLRHDFASSLTSIDEELLSDSITVVLLSAIAGKVAQSSRAAKLINLHNIFWVSPLERFLGTIGSVSVPDARSRWS
jgi:hypothetical protein